MTHLRYLISELSKKLHHPAKTKYTKELVADSKYNVNTVNKTYTSRKNKIDSTKDITHRHYE